MSITLTCASNFECWTFVAEAIVNCGVAAELRCKLEVGGYRTFEPSPKEYFQCRSVERCAPAHGFAPCIHTSLAPLGAEYIGGQNYQKQKHGADVSARRTAPWSQPYWWQIIERSGLLAMGRDRGGRSRIRLGDQLMSSSCHRSPSPRLRCHFHDD